MPGLPGIYHSLTPSEPTLGAARFMRSRRITCALLGGVATLMLAGCGGGSGSSCTPKAGSAPGSIDAPADCPVNAVIAVDATGAIADKSLAADVSAAAQRAAEQTITAGGHLRVFVFAGDANDVEVIYDDDVPTLKQSDETRRGPTEQALRNALGTSLNSALGVTRSDLALTRHVRELTHGGTSDIARAVRNGLQTLAPQSGAKALTLVSDGAQASDQLMLAQRVDAGDPASSLATKLGGLLGTARGVAVVQVIGLGRLPGHVNESARRTDKLVEIWKRACEHTGATQCTTTTEL